MRATIQSVVETVAGGARRGIVLVLMALTVLAATVVAAPGADAHATGGQQATDWRSRVLNVTGGSDVVSARSVDLGNRVTISVAPGHDVVVLGYDGEPYLRIGPRGVDENVRAPSSYLNRSSTAPTSIPARYDARATPEWVHRSDGRSWHWHDHRAHHTKGQAANTLWAIPIVIDGRPASITGETVHVAPAVPWLPIAVLVIAGALALVVDGPTRAIALLVAIAAAAVLIGVGILGFGSEGAGTRASAIVYTAIAAIATGAGAVWTARRPRAWSPVLLVAGTVAIVAAGFTFLSWLTHSQLPTAMPRPLAQVLVAFVLGAGAGAVVTGALHLAEGTPRAAGTSPRSGAAGSST